MKARDVRWLPSPTAIAVTAIVALGYAHSWPLFVTLPIALALLLYGSYYETQLVLGGRRAEGK